MIPLLFGIVALIWGGVNCRRYFLYHTGIKTKAIVTKAINKEVRVSKRIEMMAEITYEYKIEGKDYTNTEISNEKRHMFKTHAMKSEPISIMVWRGNHSKSTCLSSKNYLTSLIAFIFMGIILTLIGISVLNKS